MPLSSPLICTMLESFQQSIVGVEFVLPPFICTVAESFQQSIVGVEFEMPPFISSDLQTEWKTFGRYKKNQPKVIETVSNLENLVKVWPTLPAGTASVERSFSQMKMTKTD